LSVLFGLIATSSPRRIYIKKRPEHLTTNVTQGLPRHSAEAPSFFAGDIGVSFALFDLQIELCRP
jgi:hypothetical protein